jgi:hypothetical protein
MYTLQTVAAFSLRQLNADLEPIHMKVGISVYLVTPAHIAGPVHRPGARHVQMGKYQVQRARVATIAHRENTVTLRTQHAWIARQVGTALAV